MADVSSIDVGVLYNGELADVITTDCDLIDAVSLIPETLWHESTERPRYRPIPDAFQAFDEVAAAKPVVLHGVGLSIGSGVPLDWEHLERVIATIDRYGARWYSEHLAAFRVSQHASGPSHAGVGLPIPFDVATLRLLVPKLEAVVAELDVPFLLENSAIYVDIPGQEMTEAAFLNRISEETGAGVLLDLHNLMVNEVNLGWDAEAYLSELDLRSVVEVHVAGGEMLGAWYTDAHSGACPERVWNLLELVATAASDLRLMTFEIHESRVPVLGISGVREQLSRLHHAE